jgi:hypothetical protein
MTSEPNKGNGGASKEQSMLLQKQMIGDHYQKLARAKEDGRKVVYTFVPGNLTELMRSFDLPSICCRCCRRSTPCSRG